MKKIIVAGRIFNDDEIIGVLTDDVSSLLSRLCMSDTGWEMYCYSDFLGMILKGEIRKVVPKYKPAYERLVFKVQKGVVEGYPEHRAVVGYFPIRGKVWLWFWHIDPESVKKDVLAYGPYPNKNFKLRGGCMFVKYSPMLDEYLKKDCDFVMYEQSYEKDLPQNLKEIWHASNNKFLKKE